jgi:hypothetical protein
MDWIDLAPDRKQCRTVVSGNVPSCSIKSWIVLE